MFTSGLRGGYLVCSCAVVFCKGEGWGWEGINWAGLPWQERVHPYYELKARREQ